MLEINNSYALDKHDPIDQIRWIVELYEYDTLIKSDVCRYLTDISDDIISVSYDCDSSSHIKMSATLTLFVPAENKKYGRLAVLRTYEAALRAALRNKDKE